MLRIAAGAGASASIAVVGGLYVYRSNDPLRQWLSEAVPLTEKIDAAFPNLPGAPQPSVSKEVNIQVSNNGAITAGDEAKVVLDEARSAISKSKEIASEIAAVRAAADKAAKRAEDAAETATAASETVKKVDAEYDKRIAALARDSSSISGRIVEKDSLAQLGTPIIDEPSIEDRLKRLDTGLDKMLKLSQGRHFDSINTVLKGIDIREKSVKAEIDNMLVADVIMVRLHDLQACLELFFHIKLLFFFHFLVLRHTMATFNASLLIRQPCDNEYGN